MNQLKKGQCYKHYKNGKTYIIIGFGMLQDKNDWVEAVEYIEVNPTCFADTYIRASKEFKKKFKEIELWLDWAKIM